MNHVSPTRESTWSRPDYAGHGIANLMSSVVRGLGRDGEASAVAACHAIAPQRLADARHVVLLVIDGLGRAQLDRHAANGHLAATRVADLSSVFPSTTASAVTTFMTGEVPATHGLTGWHLWFRELGVVGAPLPFRVRGSDVSLTRLGADACTLFGTAALSMRLARRSVLVHPRHLCGTAYTEAHRGCSEVRAFTAIDGLFQRIVELAREPEPSFCYAYWPELDAISHVHGSLGGHAGEHLRALDRAAAECARAVDGTGTVLMVCADHGFVDTDAAHRLSLADHPRLAATLAVPLCGEPRMAFCHVRAGAEQEFTGYIAEHLAHALDCVPAREVLAGGYLGPGAAHPELESRMGTHILFMKDNYCLTDRVLGEQGAFNQAGVHGGMSDAELRVPLCVMGG